VKSWETAGPGLLAELLHAGLAVKDGEVNSPLQGRQPEGRRYVNQIKARRGLRAWDAPFLYQDKLKRRPYNLAAKLFCFLVPSGGAEAKKGRGKAARGFPQALKRIHAASFMSELKLRPPNAFFRGSPAASKLKPNLRERPYVRARSSHLLRKSKRPTADPSLSSG